MLPQDYTQWHHAYLVQGSSTTLRTNILEIKQDSSDEFIIHEIHADTLGIDQARQINTLARTKTNQNERIVLLVSCDDITVEAQNALLKSLEEPSSRLYIFISTPDNEMFLPTIRSRAHSITLDIVEKDSHIIDVREFLAMKKSDRLKKIATLFLSKKEPPTRQALKEFISAIEQVVYNTSQSKKIVRSVYNAQKYVAHRGMPSKTILEYIALQLPVIDF